MKKVSDVFKSIRYAKGETRDKPHKSTDEEGHYTVGEKEYNQQLKHVKKMAMQEAIKDKTDIGEYDQEGDMAKSDLRSIMANAKKLHDMIEDADNLPEWCQNKITLAEDYISTVANYLTAEMNEDVEHLEEKNVPTSPEKWAQAKAQAKAKFDVYPSAYANGWAAKKYKEMGGGWKSVSEEVKQVEEGLGKFVAKVINKVSTAKRTPLPQKSDRREFEKPKTESVNTDLPFEPDKKPRKKMVVPGKHGEGYSTARHLARMAMQRQSEKMKKPIKEEEMSKKAQIIKSVAKKKKETADTFQKDPIISKSEVKM